MSISSKKMVTLKSSDGKILPVEESVAAWSPTLRNMIRDYGADKIIPIPNVSSEILSKAHHYLRRLHFQWLAVSSWENVEKLNAWDEKFVRVDNRTLLELDKAADILGLGRLRDLISEKLKKNKATAIEEILKKARIEKYYTEEEEEERRKTYRIPNDTTGFLKHSSSLSSTMPNSSTKMVTLKSSDGETFEVEESVAVQARTIKNMIEADRAAKIINIDNVSGKILSKALEFCRRKHLEFVQFDNRTLTELSTAASMLKIDGLGELIFQTLKDNNTGKVVPETRNKTRIKKYYTREEEEEWRKIPRIPNDPPRDIVLNLGKKSAEDQESELWKQYSMVNDSPKERDFSVPNEPLKGKESPKYTEEEETELRKQCSIRHGHEPPKEIDFLKNLGKESTREEAEAAEEIDLSKNFRK